MTVRHVQHERAERQAPGDFRERGQRDQALGHAGRIAVGIAQVIPGPQAVEAGFVGSHGRGAHGGPARAHGDQQQIGLHRREYSPS
jgi:hypothetical protein